MNRMATFDIPNNRRKKSAGTPKSAPTVSAPQ